MPESSRAGNDILKQYIHFFRCSLGGNDDFILIRDIVLRVAVSLVSNH